LKKKKEKLPFPRQRGGELPTKRAYFRRRGRGFAKMKQREASLEGEKKGKGPETPSSGPTR